MKLPSQSSSSCAEVRPSCSSRSRRAGVVVATWSHYYEATCQWLAAHARQVFAVLPSSFVLSGHRPVSSVRTIERRVFGR